MLVAKADAYGHGAVGIAHHALRAGASAIGVSSSREALELRRAGVGARLVVLGAVSEDDATRAVQEGVEMGVASLDLARELAESARRAKRPARIHVAVDSGMHRLGASAKASGRILEEVQRSKNLELAGVMTHIAATEGANSSTALDQIRMFEAFLEEARARERLVGHDMWIHVANSAAILSGLDPLHDAVRPGIAAYGLAPDPSFRTEELQPVMSVRTRVVHVTSLEVGERVGYGGTWCAQRPTVLATLPVGYDDGVDWRLGNRGSVLVRGRRAPIVGRVSMDYTTIDVTEIPGIERGDTVTLIGRDGSQSIQADELAETVGSIPYELLCSIGKRVDRVHVSRGTAEEVHTVPGELGTRTRPRG